MKLGRKIFYDKVTGIVIIDTGQWDDVIKGPTVDEEVATYTALSERNRNTFDVLELEYGAHAQDFAECNGYRVNPEKKELEFSYPDPNEPDAPQVFGPPLTEQIEGLKQENTDIKMALAEIAMITDEESNKTQLALVELAEMFIGGME